MAGHRASGATFDEVLFADDTICISRDTKSMNKMLKAIEEIGLKSGMKLNKDKCEVMQFGGRAKIRFRDRSTIKEVQKAKYLGCYLNRENNPAIEVRGRIREAMGILKKMHVFWRHSSCSIRFKITVIQSVLYAKILFGLESAELQEGALRALDVFQLKCLRKVLKMKTTFVERGNTNEEVLRRANEHLKTSEKLRTLSEIFLERKQRFFCKVLSADTSDPIRQMAFKDNTTTVWDYYPKRVGRPKKKWATSELHRLWNRLQFNNPHKVPFDPNSQVHKAALQEYAAELDKKWKR